MITDLQTLERILAKYQCWAQRDVVSELIRLRKNESPEFRMQANTVSMWGGPGAVWEIGEFRHPDVPEEESKPDQLEFRKAIISLVGKMKDEDMSNDKAEFVADTFSKWIRDGN